MRYVRAVVSAGARRESIRQEPDGSFRIAVKEPAEQNAANRRVLVLVANALGLSARQLRIVSGHHKPSKMLECRDEAGTCQDPSS